MPTPPTSTPWVPMYQLGASVPAVVNGQWLKGVGGAMVWSAIDPDIDIGGRLGNVCKLVTDWNLATKSGWYMGCGVLNAPTGAGGGTIWYLGQTLAHVDPSYLVQRATDFTQPVGAGWYERRNNSFGWSAWVPMAGAVAYGVALPTSATDGTEAILVDSIANPTYQWRFRFNAQSASGYKWEFVGGNPKQVFVQNGEVVTADAYADLGVVGPQFVVPRTGEYQVRFGVHFTFGGTSASVQIMANIKIGAAVTDDTFALLGIARTASAGGWDWDTATERAATLNAGDAIKLQYRSPANDFSTVSNRWISVLPNRVG